MPDNAITYDYSSIDDFHAQMKKVVSDLESQVTQLKTDTHALLDGHWSGSAATAYDGSSAKIQKNLDGVKNWVDSLGSTVSSGGQQMADADRTNAGGFPG